ncbi:sigma-54 dependent transcriptional regulator [Coraliomargarita sp. SDUM461004]|uniref:Sigma-54 dependent transcriptional regulator n=1 Tax=Thalassobacterium sedimentorum TaxID=3041258 RepID=A0ABU1AGT6_9BACT|nr:sigma-54 dependent transcriptional regulator [Coraliomargarita sp. SDUM461004]MDQ8193804.1 sigma-54 dependent transcriptional regulator [Coraliomargarita sp. SDUM461004]
MSSDNTSTILRLEQELPGPRFAQLRKQLLRIAGSEHSLLITGPSGTGKSRLAKCIHECSGRHVEEFIEISCASIPAQLLESELFGYRKGAFSGAFKDKKGLFELADGGTLFLDEIGEMPLELQPKLLLFLQNQRFFPVGSTEAVEVDVRLMAATNQELKAAMRANKFRQDLYFRLNVFEVELPPLKERRDMIPVLAVKFLASAMEQATLPRFSDAALDQLLTYDWPGNIRELHNVMLRVATLVEPEELVLPEHLPVFDVEQDDAPCEFEWSGQTLAEIERCAVRAALIANEGKRAATAEQLGVSEKTIYNLIKRYKIEL